MPDGSAKRQTQVAQAPSFGAQVRSKVSETQVANVEQNLGKFKRKVFFGAIIALAVGAAMFGSGVAANTFTKEQKVSDDGTLSRRVAPGGGARGGGRGGRGYRSTLGLIVAGRVTRARAQASS